MKRIIVVSVLLLSIALAVENFEVNPINIQPKDKSQLIIDATSPIDLQSKSEPDVITIPKLLNYQGKLTNLAGVPVADSTYSITFRLYNTSTGGSAFWTETQNVQTNQGIFNVLLGQNTPIESMPQSGNCYLEMQVNPNPAMSPRIRLVSSAYSYLSKKSDTANYALSANVSYVDSARVSANTHKLQGKDTVALSNKFVDEGQTNAITNIMIVDNAVTSANIQDGTIQLVDLAFTPAIRPLTPPVSNTEIQDNAITSSKIQDNAVIGSKIQDNAITSSKIQDNAVVSAKIQDNAITSSKIQDNAVIGSKIQDNAIISSKIQDGTILRQDVASNFKAPYADTADYTRNVNIQYVDSARISVNAYNAYKLQGKDTLALDLRYVNEGQANAITNPMILSNAITSDKILDGTITRNDVSPTFKAPLADTADYARYLPGAIDSARVSANAHKLQGKDTLALSAKFVDEGQVNSISSAMIIDGTITRSDVSLTFKAPLADTADYVRNLTVNYVDSARIATNAHKLQGKDTVALSAKFVDEGQTNSISSAMIIDGTITNTDISATAGISDTKLAGSGTLIANLNADLLDGNHASAFALSGHTHAYIDSARVSTNTYKLQGKDTIALSNKFVDENQANSITSAMIVDGNVTMSKIAQAGATTGQVLKWTGSAWQPRNDSIGTGVFLPLTGGTMTGPITSTGDPAITMGKGNFGSGNINTGEMAFVAGRNNRARGAYTVVSGGGGANAGDSNSANGNWSVVSGGAWNSANGDWSVVSGGSGNRACSSYSTVSGGLENFASNICATVSGGYENNARGNGATISGGSSNLAIGRSATVGGGEGVAAYSHFSGVFSGYENYAGDDLHDSCAVIVGGNNNNATGKYAFIGGGRNNRARGDYSVVGGGGSPTYADSNSALGDWSVVSGGKRNSARGLYAAVGGGYKNSASDWYATVGGGTENFASGLISTVGGGWENFASGSNSTVGGGRYNFASGSNATVSGGCYNLASGDYANVGGGIGNKARGDYSVVGGGGGSLDADSNSALSDWSTVSGGRSNKAIGSYSTVGGGEFNSASGEDATVGGGEFNSTSATVATVGGGSYNSASGTAGTVGGGWRNSASGYMATVAGGSADTSAAHYSFTTNYASKVPSGYSNSSAFNGQIATGGGQTRVGTLSKASGTFTIDHPLDPMNKILNHYFVESPEMVLIYRGSVTIGDDGKAVVHLPDYFDALNKNPMIQLTGIGTSDVYVAEKVKGNMFVIGGKPGTEVYWLVTGDRKDQSAEITRIIMPVEQIKDGELRGRSLDDDFLCVTKEQLDRMGKGNLFNFRTTFGQQKYENSKQRPPETEKELERMKR
ncbi:MAG: hypothetical protein ABIK61_03110 [candidate division WOR-3 bacterium]